MPIQLHIPERISCILSEDDATGLWIGHCLDFHIVTSAKTEAAAWENLKSVVRLHVEHCFTHRPDGLEVKAPQEEFDLFEALAKSKPEELRRDKITLALVEPEEPETTFWIEGADGTTAADVQAIH